MRSLLILPVLLLAGCAPRLSFANEAGGVVSTVGVAGNDRAYALARENCAKYGSIARMTSRERISATQHFECVKP
jgi:hypothetical protein